jgi:hypothetical protein
MVNMLSLPEIRKWIKAFVSRNLLYVREGVAHGKLWGCAFKAFARDSRKHLDNVTRTGLVNQSICK